MTPMKRTHKAVEELVTGNIVFRHKRPICGEPRVPMGRLARDWPMVTCERCKAIHQARVFQTALLEPMTGGLLLVSGQTKTGG